MISVVFAILTASLLGSVHCVGMCGAFVALAVGGIDAGDAGSGPRTAQTTSSSSFLPPFPRTCATGSGIASRTTAKSRF